MSMILYHRTSVGEARAIMKRGFADTDWDFGVVDARSGEDVTVSGVWLSDRPLGRDDGVAGDALLEVTLDLEPEDLERFELEGLMWNARLWVASADLVNRNGRARITRVDPRSSWSG